MIRNRLLRLAGVCFTGVCLLTLQACHTMRFEIDSAAPEKAVEDTHWFYLFGWFPTMEIDVALKCPQGATAIKEQTTFGDGFIQIITLGIITPRSVWYYCLPGEKTPRNEAAYLLKEVEK